MASQRKILTNPRPAMISAPHVKHGITPHDASGLTIVGPTVGFQTVSFRYEDVGGPSNLKPGYPQTMTSALTHPPNASHAVVMLSAVAFNYVDGNDRIDDHHLGVVQAQLFFQDWNTIACLFYMRDDSDTEGVDCSANGVVLYF